MISPTSTHLKKWESVASNTWLVGGIMLVGILLRVVRYGLNRSLWIDEALLALSIIREGYVELLQPMSDLGQVAPIGFLWVERTAVLLLGPGELSLRLFPLLCSIVVLPVLFLFARKLSGSGLIALAVLLWFSFNPFAIYYASEVKQYASDLLIGVLLCYLGITTRFPLTPCSAIRLAAMGFLAVFFSHTAILVLSAVGLWWLLNMVQRKQLDVWLIGTGSIWILAILTNYFSFIRNHPSQPWMIHYWQKQQGFMPKNFLEGKFWQWWAVQINEVFHELLGFFELPMVCWFLLLVSLLGLYRFFRQRNFTALYFCVILIVIHLALSASYRYPFSARLILYQAPLYLLMLAAGTLQIAVWTRTVIFPVLVGAILMLPAAKLSAEFTSASEDLRPCISFMNEHLTPDQRIVIYRPARHAYQYYMQLGIADHENALVYTSDPTEKSGAAYVDELKQFKGSSWCLFTHIRLLSDPNEAKFTGLKKMLSQVGKVTQSFEAQGAYVFLVEHTAVSSEESE